MALILPLLPCLLAILVDILGFGLAYPVLTALFVGHDSTLFSLATSEATKYWNLGIAFMLYPLAMFFGTSYMGDLSDIIGRKKVLLICMAGLGSSFFLIGIGSQTDSLSLIFIGRALSGLMAASLPVALAAVADITTKENKMIAMSYVSFVQSIGFVLGPLLGGILSDHSLLSIFNFGTPFYFASILSGVAFFWIWISFRETFQGDKGKKMHPLRIFHIFNEAFCDKPIFLLSMVFLLMQAGVGIFLQTILIFLKQKENFSNAMLGIFNGYLGFLYAVALLLIVPFLVKRMKVEWLVVWALLIATLSILFQSLFPILLIIWVLSAFFGLSVQPSYTGIYASYSNAASTEKQGWAMGVAGATLSLAWTGVGFTPNLIPYTGIMGLIFWGSILTLVSFVLMLVYVKKWSRN